MPKASYFLGHSLLGEAQVRNGAASVALFCATCGEIWGRVWVEGTACWQVQSSPCEQHEPQGVFDWGHWPGSFALMRDDPALHARWSAAVNFNVLPAEVLRREVLIAIAYLEKHND